MKKIYVFLLFTLWLSALNCRAQQNNFNPIGNEIYKDVNPKFFYHDITVPVSDEIKYLVSVARVATLIQQVYSNNTIYPFNNTINLNTTNELTIHRTNRLGYSKNQNTNINSNYRAPQLLFIRPTNNTNNPCILLTAGVGENFNTQWSGTILFAANLAMRGYAVAIYDNMASSSPDNCIWQTMESYPTSLFFCTSFDPNKEEKTTYSMVQLGYAAMAYVTNSIPNANLNTSAFFAAGGSYGALSSMFLAYADDNTSGGTPCFQSNIFTSNMGNFYGRVTTGLTIPAKLLANRIRAVACIGGAIYKNNSSINIGTLYDASDAVCPMLYLNSNYDLNVNINTGSIPASTFLTGLTNLAGLTQYNSSGINVNYYINLDANSQHPFSDNFSEGLTPSWASLPTSLPTLYLNNNDFATALNNPNSLPLNTRLLLKKYIYSQLQGLDMGTYIATYFRRRMGPNSTTFPIINANTVKYVKPIDVSSRVSGTNNAIDYFPTLNYPNGHYANASCTLGTPVCSIPFVISIGSVANNFRQANPNPTAPETKATSLPLMFPNPTTGKLNINLKLDNEVNGYNVNIFSVDGRSILNNTNSEKMEAGNVISKEFDISEQPNGVYFIRVTSENNILLNKTFILNK